MRILVTGSREFTDLRVVQDALLAVTAGHRGPHTLVHGAAKGADTLAAIVAGRLGWTVEPHPALWDVHDMDCPDWHHEQPKCRRAGHRRNEEMVDLGADIVCAFYKRGAANKGTAGCVKAAGQAGITVKRWTS
jgi:hypothetical protein